MLDAPSSVVDGAPGSLPPFVGKKGRAYKKVARDYMQMKMAGIDPAHNCIISDIGSSDDRARSLIEICPTVTASRAKGHAFWISTRGRAVSRDEMCRFMSFEPDNMNFATLKKRDCGDLIGNSLCQRVIALLLQRGLQCVNLVEEELSNPR